MKLFSPCGRLNIDGHCIYTQSVTKANTGYSESNGTRNEFGLKFNANTQYNRQIKIVFDYLTLVFPFVRFRALVKTLAC